MKTNTLGLVALAGGVSAAVLAMAATPVFAQTPVPTPIEAPADPAAPPSPNTVVLEADTPQFTASGAGFIAPRGWSVTNEGAVIKLAPPEPDNHFVIVDVPQAADGAAAVEQAWRTFRPEFGRSVEVSTPAPATDGWDEILTFAYETSPNERLHVGAAAMRQGSAWTVALYEVTHAVAGVRGAAFSLISSSLKAPGHASESFAGRTANPLDAARIEALRDFLETSMAELGIPGVGFALYDQGRVVYQGGIGVKETGRPEPVDADTLFMIASNTKGMTTLLLAKLVDEGRLRWDQPVREVYPAFRLGSEATSEQVLFRHLVCACTGLPRQDLVWLLNAKADAPVSIVFDQLAAIEPTSGFGDLYQYNNQMPAAAGYIAGHLYFPDMEVGAAYDRAMQEQVLDPLGMTSSTFNTAQALTGNVAMPHSMDLSGEVPLINLDVAHSVSSYRPTGGLWSSPSDMIRYVANELRQGELPNGGRIVSAEALLARREPGVSEGQDAFYGMGLTASTTGGVEVINHGGSLPGYKSDIIFIPEAGVGAVLLTNSDEGGLLLAPFRRRLMEILYEGRPEAAATVATQASANRIGLAAFAERLSAPPAPELSEALASTYTNPVLGDLKVRREGQAVIFQFPTTSSAVASRSNDDGTVSFVTIDPALLGVTLVVAERDGRGALIVREAQHEYVYREVR